MSRLEDRATVRALWIAFGAVLAALLGADLFLAHEPHLPGTGVTIDTVPGFLPAFGFLACVALIALAKALAIPLKRDDTYYGD